MTRPDWRAEFKRLSPKIQKALGDEGYTLEWLESRLEDKKAFIWFGERSALAVEVDAWTIAAAGDQRELIDVLRPQAEAWGQALGLSQVIIDGRPGWRRSLAPHGYLPFNGGVRKELI